MAAPPELKLAEAIQTHILPETATVVPERGEREYRRTRWVRDAWRRGWPNCKLKVFAKLGVKGYQPYERLGLWLRRELRPIVGKLLLDDRCLSRGVFNPETVRLRSDEPPGETAATTPSC